MLSGKKMRFESSASAQNKNAEKALRLIQQEGVMHRYELMNHLGLTLAQMIPFNSYLVFALQNFAEYNKKSQQWILIKEPEKEKKN